MSRFERFDAATISAMAGAAAIGAQYVAGKAARDALFLAHFEPTALPPMIIGTSIVAVLLVVVSSKTLARVPPDVYVPASFAVNAAFLLGAWGLDRSSPRVAAPMLYLLVSGVGPLLSSGFWLIASEQFDPRTAKKRFGQIGSAGTVGGLVGALAAARLSSMAGVGAIIPLLAALNVVCAWQTRSWARLATEPARRHTVPAELPTGSGIRVLSETHYLRQLALVVLLTTIAAAFVDYVFKVQVKANFEAGPHLASFFSLYYAGVSLITFALQAFASRPVLQKLGHSAAMSVPSLSVIAGGAAALVNPGLSAIVATRGAEAVFRGSLLRAGYEVFYTPIAPADKRAVKAVVDVGVDRGGDILAAGVIQILVWTAIGGQLATLVGLAVACSLLALVLANGLSRGYASAVKQGLINRAVQLDLAAVEDRQTRTVILATMHHAVPVSVEQEVEDFRAMRSGDADRVRQVLQRRTPLSPSLVPDAIRLLEWDAVADDAVRALRRVAERRVGELIDALTDPQASIEVRRRLARVFSVCSSQRAADGLLLGLAPEKENRFEVRVQCARSLVAVVERNPLVRIDPAQVSAMVLYEVAVNRGIWEKRLRIESVTADGDKQSPFDEVVGERARRALAHVFTLLELILPSEMVRAAYRGLHSTDKNFHSFALEYLEDALPPDIRVRLWPFLERGAGPRAVHRPQAEIVQDLLRSNQSILLDVQQLKAQRKKGVQ